MYESIGYETYAESDAFKDGKKDNFLKGWIIEVWAFEYENSTAGYDLAKANSPLDSLDRGSEKERTLWNLLYKLSRWYW
jgi:hypothetical protein